MKTKAIAAALLCAALSGCVPPAGQGTQSSGSSAGILGQILGSSSGAGTVGNVIASIIGIDKPTKEQLIGAWKYSAPGVAFTSDQTLARAGGEIAAAKIKDKLKGEYSKVGITAANTSITLNDDGSFKASIVGKSLSGRYTFTPEDGKLSLNILGIELPCYAKRVYGGMAFLMESKKFLTLVQTMASLSGNANLQAVSEIAANYDGVRVGFEMAK